jgi:energy-coupling factor transporter ATP-binding protein EcfA2
VAFSKLTALENLSFFTKLYRHTADVEPLLRQVGLWPDKDKKVGEYSKGMKVRLNFVRALLNRPTTLFLDEPTSGLDPVNSRIVKDMIADYRSNGGTVFLTSHIMSDIDELCDRVAFVSHGRIAVIDTPHNLAPAVHSVCPADGFHRDEHGPDRDGDLLREARTHDRRNSDLTGQRRRIPVREGTHRDPELTGEPAVHHRRNLAAQGRDSWPLGPSAVGHHRGRRLARPAGDRLTYGAKDFTAVMLRSVVYMFVIWFPGVFTLFGLIPDTVVPYVLVLPPVSAARMLAVAFSPVPSWQVVFGYAYLLLLCAVLYVGMVHPVPTATRVNPSVGARWPNS